MHYRVVQLIAAGVRRPRDEARADPGIAGVLLVDVLAPAENSRARPLRRARVVKSSGMNNVYQNLISPLFDVELLRATPAGLLLRGVQIHAEGGRAIEFAQGWWCRPVP